MPMGYLWSALDFICLKLVQIINGLQANLNSIRTCVTSNYAELKAGFAVSRMPRNFQDAIIVATQLGVRYVNLSLNASTFCLSCKN